jgi:hypothetical protein
MRAGALPEYRAGLAVGAGMTRQWTRQWTREALDAAHPKVKAAGWEWMAGGSDILAWRRTDHGIVQVSVVNGSHAVDRHPYDRTPVPVAVSEAVILASRGMDSLGAMAAAMTVKADESLALSCQAKDECEFHIGCASAWLDAAAMLRRGTVQL